MNRKCTRCERIKAEWLFYWRDRERTRLSTICADCENKARSARYRKSRDARAEEQSA